MRVLTLSRKAIIDDIILPEVISREYYTKKLQQPMWPGGISGITIGFGYDLGMQTPENIQNDLEGLLPQNQIDILKNLCGRIGIMCKRKLPIAIDFPWDTAMKLFYRSSLRRYASQAAMIWPELEELHPLEQTIFVGIVYNRGKGLDGNRRKEMRDLIKAIKDDDDTVMASLVKSMTRLWKGTGMDGLVIRYEKYAREIALPDGPVPEEDKLLIEV